MVVLGIVLAGAAVVVGAALVAGSASPASLGVFGHHVPGVHTSGQVLIVGAAVATLVIAGILMSWLSLLRSLRLRRELSDLRDEREESMSTLMTQYQQLQRELARTRGGATSTPAAAAQGPESSRQGREHPEPSSPFFDHA